MADSDISLPVSGTGDTGPKKVDTRTVGALTDEHRQVVVLGDPSTAAGVAGVDASNGLDVDVTRIGTGDNTVGRVKITDGTTVASVRDVTGGNDALNVVITKLNGDAVESFGGSGGTSEIDDAAFTAASDSGTPIMGFVTSDTVDSGDVGVVGMTADRELTINVASVSTDLDQPHGNADAGAPVKVGSKAMNALPTAVDADDRANAISDLFGRLLMGHIAPGMQSWKAFSTSSAYGAGSAATVWTPGSGKKIAITHFVISTSGTTTGTVYFYLGNDQTYTYQTDQLVFAGTFAPSSTLKPGAVVTPAVPIYCNTADYKLYYQCSTALTIDAVFYGYEF